MFRYANSRFSIVFALLAFYVISNNAQLPKENERFKQNLMLLDKKADNTLKNVDFEEKLQPIEASRILRNYKVDSKLVEDVYNKENATINGLSYRCGRDIGLLQTALVLRELWAMKMLDSSSKIPAGLLEGNIVDLGMFDECLKVKGTSLGIEVRGRHCMYSVKATQSNITLPINPTLSICVPTTCSAEDVVTIMNYTINKINKFKNIGIAIDSAICSKIDVVVWDTEFIVCFSILITFVTFLVICTMIDIKKSKQLRHPLLLALSTFSMRKSVTSIFSMKKKAGSLPALHGIRFLSMAWVVLGHEYVMQMINVNVNMLYIREWTLSWKSLYIYIAPFAVDTFFTLSGFLMTYLFLKEMQKQTNFNIPLYYLHRIIRITPSVIALIIFTIVFVPKIGSGAHWDNATELFADTCRTKWWSNLLFVQNFVKGGNLCLGHLWYLAVDMQLFWMSPLILYPLNRKPKFGLMILFLLFIASVSVPMSIVAINKYRPVSFLQDPNPKAVLNVFMEIYIKPYNRAAPWLIGIFLGYEVSNKNLRFGTIGISIGWVLTLGAFAYCTFGTRSFMDPNYVYNAVWESFFNSTSRPIWACAISWIVYASIFNHAGPISTFLSWDIFLPLSRLSYCVYLVHIVLQMIFVSVVRTPAYFSTWNMWHIYFSDLVISFIVAFFFSLLFESPILAFEKIALRRNTDSEYSSQKELRPGDEEEACKS